MATEAWQPGRLYQPGDLVRPRSGSPVVTTTLPNPGFESDLTDWSFAYTGGTPPVGNGPTPQTDFVFSGSKAVRYKGGPGSGESGSIEMVLRNDQLFPVRAGQSVGMQLRAALNTAGGSYCRVQPRIYWLNGSEEDVAFSGGPIIDGKRPSGWRTGGATDIAPSGAVYAQIAVWVTGNGNGFTDLDDFSITYAFAGTPTGLIFRATQADSGYSGAAEPVWPVVVGETVYDNEVVWEGVLTSRVVWEASPILVSGSTEPDFPEDAGSYVSDNTIAWRALSRRIDDPKCPHSKVVTIAASKIFAADDDIVAYSSTVNPLDWSSPNDAGYLPFGLQAYGANPVSALGLYRSNLVASNSVGYQMWQVDQNPANMAYLDGQPIPFAYHKSLQPAANDLVGLTDEGIRSIGIAGASTNLQAGFFGKAVDPLVKPLIKATKAAGYDPLGIMWPAMGQYWLVFGAQAMVLTINGPSEKDMSWSRYTFPEEITDWTIDGTALFLRAGELVWEVSEDANTILGPADDVFCDLDDAPVLANMRVDTSNHLSWTEVDEAIGYRLYNAATDALIIDTPALSHIDAGLAEYSDHSYYVVAYNGGLGVSPHSNTVTGNIGGPFPPSLDGEVQSDNASALLTWTAATSGGGPIVGYRLYDADSLAEIADVPDLEYLDTGLDLDTVYSYFVRSYTAENESANSNTITLDTGHPEIIVDLFTRGSHTWTKRPFLVSVDVQIVSAGGGGSGGRGGIIGGATRGGGGGGGGYAGFSLDAGLLGATESVQVGMGGNGGGTGAPASSGSSGGASSFGSWGSCSGGQGGPPYTGSGGSTAAGGIGSIAAVGPTSKVTELGGVGAQKEGAEAPPGSTVFSGAGGGRGDGGTGGSCTASPALGLNAGNGGVGGINVVGGSGHPGLSGNVAGGGGGGGGAGIGISFPPQTFPGGTGGTGADGIVVVTNYLTV